MATNRWLGKAQKTAQVNTITPANVNIGNTFTVTINGKAYTFTATAATVANVTAGLVALLQASTEGEFTEITWTDSTTHVTGTAVTPGTPFTQTSSASGGTATLTTATATANVSPNDVNNATNWSDGVPDAADDVILDAGDVDLLWNLSSLAAVALTSFTRRRTFTGKIGLPEYNEAGDYFEYRATEFAALAATWTIEQAAGDDVEHIKITGGATNATVRIDGEGGSALGSETLWWRGTGTNTIHVVNGSLAIAPVGGVAGSVSVLNAEASTVRMGPTVAPATVNNTDSAVDYYGNCTTLNQKGAAAETTARGTGTLGTGTIDEGTLNYLSSGTITTLEIGTDATFTKGRSDQAVTITNLVNIHAGGTLDDQRGTLTLSAGFRPYRCRLNEITVDLGPHRTFASIS